LDLTRNVEFGVTVSGVGDIDGNGTNDVAVYESLDSKGAVAVLFLDRTAGFVDLDVDSDESLADREWITARVRGGAPAEQFGSYLAHGYYPWNSDLGDFDGDGMHELLAGSDARIDGGAPGLGAASMYFGRPVSEIIDPVHGLDYHGPVDGLYWWANEPYYFAAMNLRPAHSGATPTASRTVGFVGDVNGDGRNDVAVGDPNESDNDGRIIFVN
jgi:hypothetical protein